MFGRRRTCHLASWLFVSHFSFLEKHLLFGLLFERCCGLWLKVCRVSQSSQWTVDRKTNCPGIRQCGGGGERGAVRWWWLGWLDLRNNGSTLRKDLLPILLLLYYRKASPPDLKIFRVIWKFVWSSSFDPCPQRGDFVCASCLLRLDQTSVWIKRIFRSPEKISDHLDEPS